jgi:hypothetical protein
MIVKQRCIFAADVDHGKLDDGETQGGTDVHQQHVRD